ncbi:hypothetical protein INR49_022801 [Caranx melampygus]|nr:hypothetical protein INR49_022801 [Caranx melampygus]
MKKAGRERKPCLRSRGRRREEEEEEEEEEGECTVLELSIGFVRRHNMKVRINATGDTIVMKFVRPSPDVKLEGYILGYGSSMFSKQFIQLPEDGRPYETEMDAEPKYLVAVQPIPVNDMKKHCTGKVNLEKPLHLVIGSVSPTAVLLSWGNYLKTPYEGNIMNECLEDGFYTIRYRERNRKWNYQTCPTSDTVIDNLKPNTPYEFGVRSNKDDRSGSWSKPVIHNTNMGSKTPQKPFKLRNPLAKPMVGSSSLRFPSASVALTVRCPPVSGSDWLILSSRNLTDLTPCSRLVQLCITGRSLGSPLHSKLPAFLELHAHPSRHLKAGRKLPLCLAPPTLTGPQCLWVTDLFTDIFTCFSSAMHLGREGAGSVRGSSCDWLHVSMLLPTVSQSQDASSLLRSALANERARANSWGQGGRNLSPSLPFHPLHPAAAPLSRSMRPASRNPLSPLSNGFRLPHSSSRPSPSAPTSGILRGSPPADGLRPRGLAPPRPVLWSRPRLVNNSLPDDQTSLRPDVFSRSDPTGQDRLYGSPVRPSIPLNKRPNQVGKPGDTDKVNNLKQTDKLPVLKPRAPPASAKPTKPERRQSTTLPPTTAASRQETWEDSDLFKSQPTSDIDAMGKKRFVAPHVIYQTGKGPDEPCSITSSLNYFPEDEPGETNVTAPPRAAPSNLTVVTVEGCPSFIILDWEKTDNDTTEYEVISTAKGPDGEQVSILTTNQTHTAVENLKPESSYEFKVKPKNELGEGPPSEPVSFNTESADPRVSENVSGKDAIWTQFPFKTDSYSDCHGKQYVKRTWYRKFVGVQLCNSLRYKIYLSDSLNGKFYNLGDQSGFGEDHCQFVDSFLDGRTGRQLRADQLPSRPGFYRAVRQEPVHFGQIGGPSHVSYVSWYECGTPIPGKW